MLILGLVAEVHESELTSFVYETHIGYLGTLPALIGQNQDLKNYVPVNWEYICSLSYGDTLSLSLHFGDHLGVSSPDMDRHWGPAKTRYELSEYPNLNTSALGRYMGDMHNIHENRTSV